MVCIVVTLFYFLNSSSQHRFRKRDFIRVCYYTVLHFLVQLFFYDVLSFITIGSFRLCSTKKKPSKQNKKKPAERKQYKKDSEEKKKRQRRQCIVKKRYSLNSYFVRFIHVCLFLHFPPHLSSQFRSVCAR